MLKKLAKLSLLATALSVGAGQAQAARGIDYPTALITKTFSGSGVIEVVSSDG